MNFDIPAPGPSKVTSLDRAIADNVRPGDSIHLGMTQSRSSAAWYELIRRFRGTDPRFEFLAVQMTAPMAALVHAGLARKIVTSWAGNSYWSPGPNRIYQDAWSAGLPFEHWSILTYAQRLACGARGLAHTTTRSLRDSSMMENAGVSTTSDGDVLIPALVPDVSILHAPLADATGNALFSPPLFEDVSGALGARRGCILTVERIVDTEVVRAHSHLARIPGSRVLAVVEVPMGAHPGGLVPNGLEHLLEGYGEDYEFWVAARDASANDASMDAWIDEWISNKPDHADVVRALGSHVDVLRARASAPFEESRVDERGEATPVERAIVAMADVLVERVRAEGLNAMLAGAGNANLAAWLAAYRLGSDGVALDLIAEMGQVGYWPRPGEPILFNPRNMPTATMLADIDRTLSIFIGGGTARSIGALGAAQIDRTGAMNSTEIPGERLLMGSGGANDVLSTATETVVLGTQSRSRMIERVPYVTGPGFRVVAFVTEYGVYRKHDGELTLTAVWDEADVAAAKERCGWDLRIAPSLTLLEPPSREDLVTLRRMDPAGWFRA